MYEFDDYTSEAEYIERHRRIYRQYGLSIFETFEEYMMDRMEEQENEAV